MMEVILPFMEDLSGKRRSSGECLGELVLSFIAVMRRMIFLQ